MCIQIVIPMATSCLYQAPTNLIAMRSLCLPPLWPVQKAAAPRCRRRLHHHCNSAPCRLLGSLCWVQVAGCTGRSPTHITSWPCSAQATNKCPRGPPAPLAAADGAVGAHCGSPPPTHTHQQCCRLQLWPIWRGLLHPFFGPSATGQHAPLPHRRLSQGSPCHTHTPPLCQQTDFSTELVIKAVEK